jgi:hypothetical protein
MATDFGAMSGSPLKADMAPSSSYVWLSVNQSTP